MITLQSERKIKVGRFMNQWGVTGEVAIAYLEADGWIYQEACVTYSIDMDGEL